MEPATRLLRFLAVGAASALLVSCGAGRDASDVAQGALPPPAPPSAPASTSASASAPTSAGTGDLTPTRHTFTTLMTGDVLLHSGLWATAHDDAVRLHEVRAGYDFRPVLAPMRSTVAAADLAICHLETPLGPAHGPFTDYPLFSVPPQIAPALAWAGYDACTTASNHSVDGAFPGIRRTLSALDAAGVAHTGSYDRVAGAGRPVFLTVPTHAVATDGRPRPEADGTARVALIAATFWLNGLPEPEGRPWAVNLIHPARILAQARAARASGADVVLVALHWGDQYVHVPSAFQERVARRLTVGHAVDLVYGHHAHVVQPFEKVNDTWVVYGLGNAVAQQDTADPELYEGIAADVRFTTDASGRYRVTAIGWTPTLMTSYGVRPMRYLNAVTAQEDPRYAALRGRMRQAVARSGRYVGSRGAFHAGATAAPGRLR